MKRLVPRPFLTLVLLVLWLILNDSMAPVDLLLGTAIGVAGSAVYGLLKLAPARAKPVVGSALVLLWLVLVDIIRSNIAVAGIVLRLSGRDRVAGFLPIPLQLRDPAGLAVLACIVTATPGTSWARHDEATGVLTLHVLDLVEPEQWVRQFQDRYERRLMEIFE
jgi:multicomponent K+:H+ antiporter subunit E